ncbi:putative transcription factor interactor and regulator FHA-SMAD family [Dioscorea sansibarensis]
MEDPPSPLPVVEDFSFSVVPWPGRRAWSCPVISTMFGFRVSSPMTLNLTVDRGFGEVETLEFGVGAVIRIGRVIRGNTFAIKDPGVSQKHLCLQFDAGTSRWTVTDLDTSNGTFLNGSLISPSVPAALSHGDSIKFGESVSIYVGILDSDSLTGKTRASSRKDPSVAPPCLPARTRGGRKQKDENSEPKKVGRGGNMRVRVLNKEETVREVGRDDSETVDVVKERVDGTGGVEWAEEVDDMGKMTLGEWFDRMEKYLPQVINEEAQGIIAGLQEKGRMFTEFIMANATITE